MSRKTPRNKQKTTPKNNNSQNAYYERFWFFDQKIVNIPQVGKKNHKNLKPGLDIKLVQPERKPVTDFRKPAIVRKSSKRPVTEPKVKPEVIPISPPESPIQKNSFDFSELLQGQYSENKVHGEAR